MLCYHKPPQHKRLLCCVGCLGTSWGLGGTMCGGRAQWDGRGGGVGWAGRAGRCRPPAVRPLGTDDLATPLAGGAEGPRIQGEFKAATTDIDRRHGDPEMGGLSSGEKVSAGVSG